jgi:putative NADH-flavin reductase
MKVLILGPAGRTGQHLVKQALEQGHEVRVIAREPAKMNFKNQNLEIIAGDVLENSVLEKSMNGIEVVLSALGRGNSLKSGNLISSVMTLLIPAMQKNNVSRIIFLSAFGVGESFRQASWLQKIAFRFPFKDIYADKLKGETLLKQSNLNWTLVYPVLLTDKPFTGRYSVVERTNMKGFPSVSRADVADFMLSQITDTRYLKKSPIIMS